MIIIRPITFKDLEAYEQLAMQSSAGIFNLPKNRALLQKKIQDSLLAFSSHGSQAENEVYVFVLEDLDTGIVGGTCGIISKTAPMHFYRLETVKQHSDHFPLAPEIKILHPMTDKKKVSEICSLYLHPKFRKDGLGKLLSFSRFFFMAAHPERFEKTIIALMRGYIVDDHSPFWNAVGKHFVNMSFLDLLAIEERGGKFLSEILPQYPIYLSLLPPEIQEIAGHVHPSTEPALNMLLKEGFTYTNEIDPFDAGPKIEAPFNEIKTIKTQKRAKVVEILPSIEGTQALISNTQLDFRACNGLILEKHKEGVALSQEVAAALNVQPGDGIRFIPNTRKKQ